MSNNKQAWLLGGLVAIGGVVGAWATARFYERQLIHPDVILQNVRRLFMLTGSVEGSWIEQTPVFIEDERFSGEVYFGGITRQEKEMMVQYEFYADATTGAVLDWYRLEN